MIAQLTFRRKFANLIGQFVKTHDLLFARQSRGVIPVTCRQIRMRADSALHTPPVFIDMADEIQW